MFVLGIDPGLSTTGYGIIESSAGGMATVAAGVVRTDPGDHVAHRLQELYHDLVDVIGEHQPDEVAIEEVFVNRNVRTAMAVGRASGVAILAAAVAGIPVFEYTPTEVKMAVTGHGQAGKEQIRAMVSRRLRLSSLPESIDTADALAVAICHLQGSGLRRAAERSVR